MNLKRHIPEGETPRHRRLRYFSGGVLVLFSLFMMWWASPWWVLFLIFIIDLYFIRYINWGWYKTSPHKWVRVSMGWVDDILFALIALTILNTYFFQNFMIPTSSLEKTLLVGDYLFVEKWSYGPRVPMTPIAVPLAHNTLPMGLGKSYLEKPHLEYKRLKGFREVQLNDIVVFNFPAGDTVAVKMPNPDYYTLKAIYGKQYILDHPKEFGELVYRPVDRRDHYVKRCVALPGDTLIIRDNQIYLNGKRAENPKEMQLNYFVQTNGTAISEALLDELGVNYRDVAHLASGGDFSSIGLELLPNGTYGQVYHMPLTEAMRAQLEREPYVASIRVETSDRDDVYPIGYRTGWTRDNYGPIVIPKRGMTVALTPQNVALYERCITAYEGHTLEVQATGGYLIDGVPSDSYTFQMDYYWMMGDNRHNSADSRYWGFVPEDHVVGRPFLLWFSRNSEKGLFSGGIRWSRMFRIVSSK